MAIYNEETHQGETLSLYKKKTKNTAQDPAYNEQKDAKETARCNWVLDVTELLTLLATILVRGNQPGRCNRTSNTHDPVHLA